MWDRMVEAFEDMTSCPGLWSSYDVSLHPALATVSRASEDVGESADGYLIISNISKNQNIRSLLSVAVAYGIEHAAIVGQPGFDMQVHAPPGSVVSNFDTRLQIHRFPDLDACRTFLKSRGVR